MKRLPLLIIVVGLVINLISAAFAGEVTLKNGDRLTGTIVRKDAEAVVIKTDYAGEITVTWEQVRCLVTEQDLDVVLSGDQTLSGKIVCPKEGAFQVVGADGVAGPAYPLTELAAVNPPPDLRYRGDVVAGGSLASGNTDSRSYYGNARLELRTDAQRFTASARGNYSEADDTVTAQSASGTFKYDYFLTEQLYAYGQSLLEQDRLQDLDLRSTFGAGLGYQLIDTDRAGIFVEAGLSYVNEDYEVADNRSYASGRWAAGIDWDIVKDRIAFFHRQEGYVSVEDAEDWFVRTQQGFRLPLIDNFFTNLQYDFDYTNQPAPGKKTTDTRFIFGLGYEFAN